MRIAITGHRPNKLGNDYNLTSPLIQKIESSIEIILLNQNILRIDTDPDTIKRIRYNKETDTMFITGMALGIDTLFAQIAIKYNIPFTAAIPFKGQESVWPQRSKLIYHNILQKASKIVICDVEKEIKYEDLASFDDRTSASLSYKMQKRNIWMVDNSALLIAVWDETSGGTRNCVEYAISIHRDYIHIDPKTMTITNHIAPNSKISPYVFPGLTHK